MKRSLKIFLLALPLLVFGNVSAQRAQFSLATDFSLQRSVRSEQKYWAIGQTVLGLFNFSPRDGAYAWLCYYTDGKFTNQVEATAKSTTTTPQQISYANNAALGFKHISLGWRHYMVGANNKENGWNFYGQLGLGLMLGVVENTQSAIIDTASYAMPVLPGKANFKRLTYDLGLGLEKPVGGDIYLYAESKALIPSTDYPSDHLLVNQDAPLTFFFNIGLRVLFGN